MSVITKDLGAATAYAYAVEKGYTGTEAEFAELMADYANVGQRAENAADSALESKSAAQTAAQTATNKASEAMSAASTVTSKATEATTAAATATSAASTATTAKDDAVSAKTAAQTAQTGAETARDAVQSSAAQIATNASDITALKEELKNVDSLLYSVNKYDRSKQTSDTISPHYYVNGVPYSSTQFDSSFNCTAPIPVKSNTLYTVGIVPAYNSIVKPWSSASYGVFFYDAENNYISGTSNNTFATPANCAYIRFNYYIASSTITLTRLNERCMLVEGDTLPATWSAFYDNTFDAESIRSAEHGVYKTGNVYYHFIKCKYGTDDYILRKFEHRGPNNLFQWSGIYAGTIDYDGVLHINTIISGYGTDIVGPMSIYNLTRWPNVYGLWVGGNHGRKIDNVTYPTAEELTFKCRVNGKEITDDGLYIGDVTFETSNKIYYAQSVTTDGLANAIPAVKEYRTYRLDSKMKVSVRLEFIDDVKVSVYYGMQLVTYPFHRVKLYNNGICNALSVYDTAHIATKKERKIELVKDDGIHLDAYLHDLGIGDYAMNNSPQTYGYVNISKQVGDNATQKLYYVLLANTTNEQVSNGTNVFWEGVYDIYVA